MSRLTFLPLMLLLAGLPATALGFDHKPLDAILRAHVRGGRVDYAGIKARDADKLAAYVKAVGSASVSGMSKNAKLAFYLNAYNALVIKAVVDRWPGITSVMKVPGFFKSKRYKVAGRTVTLDQLENKVIRPTFKEPRIHFALVCAARSCPPLPSRAFSASGLDKTLDRLARSFINSSRGVQVSGDTIRVSRLFEWYAGDFVAAAGSVGKFLARYHKTHADKLKAATKLDYLNYDWALNKK